MSNGTLVIYASLAGQAAPLPGVRLEVLDETGSVLARTCTGPSGAAEVPDLPAPDARYSLAESNDSVRPYAVYRLTARADGWQAQVLDGIQVFAGQQTVARLAFLPVGPAAEGAAPRDGLDSAVYTRSPPTRCTQGTAAAARRRSKQPSPLCSMRW